MSNENEPVTKKELDDVLNKWTHDEIVPTVESMFEKFGKKMKAEISREVTKNVTQEIKNAKNEIIEIKDGMVQVKDEVIKAKDEILKSNDRLAGEIIKDREEFMATIMSSEQVKEKNREHDNKLDNHESRIKTLEANPA